MKRVNGQRVRSSRMFLGLLPLLAGTAVGAVWMLRRAVLKRSSPSQRRDPAGLLAAIPGNTRDSIAAVFGPPRASAGFAAVAPAMLVSADYLHADIWYYPLDLTTQTALIVRFSNHVASDAELVQLPDPLDR